MVQPVFDIVPPEQPASDSLNLSIQDERERIASHLHDNMAQDLAFMHSQAAAIRILLSKGKVNRAIEQVKLLEEVSQTLSGGIRTFISELNNVDKVSSGLDVALGLLIERFNRRCQIPVHYKSLSPSLSAGFSPQVSLELYNIVQEALTNVCKHADASAVWVQLIEKEMCFDLIVRDDGRGFRAVDLEKPSKGNFGLSIMQARARKVGARLLIEEPSDQGTQVTVCIPHRSERQI